MPKKTRKQKLRADARHQSFIPPLSEVAPSITPAPAMFHFKPTSQKGTTGHPDDMQELAAIRSDLTKTIMLAIIAVGVELLVYWRFFSK